MMYGSWNIRHNGQNFLLFWAIFILLTLLTTQKIKILKKWKKTKQKTPGDIIILHLGTTNDNHMMYGYWDTERDRQNFFSFWINLPPNYQEIKILKKWKKRLEIWSFYMRVTKIMIICYAVPEIWHVTDIIIFHFGLFLTLLLH